VAVPDAPPTTVMGAQALDMEVPSAQQSAGSKKEALWAMIWEAEVQAAHGVPEPAAVGTSSREGPGQPGEAGDGGREGAARTASSTEQTQGVVPGAELGALGNDALLPLRSGKARDTDARVAGVESAGALSTGPTGSQAGVSWAMVAAGQCAARPRAKGRAQLQIVVRAAWEQDGKGAAGAGGKPTTRGLALGAAGSEPTPSALGSAQVKDQQPKQGRRHGVGETVKMAEEDKLPLDLPDEVLFEVLARVPITELRRLLRQRVSRGFAAAIRSVFLEIASQAVRRACDLDKQGAVGDKEYERAFKLRFIISPPSKWIDTAYSARDCNWRSGPLFKDSTSRMYSGWPASSAEPRTWLEGGRKLQTGLPWQGTGWGDPVDDWEGAEPSPH
jgi:hypothetical protein